MKKLKLILCLPTFILLFYTIQSCIGNNNEYTKQETTNDKTKIYTDSIVSLQIKGIKLGYPLEETIKNAQEKGYIDDIHTYDYKYYKEISCYANFELPNEEENYNVKLRIAVISYQDTITNIIIKSDDYISWSKLKVLYKSKYNEKYATEDSDYGYEWKEGDTSKQDYEESLIWTFKDQTLKFTTEVTKTTYHYIKDPTKEYYANRYGTKVTNTFKSYSITYTDLYHYKKMKTHEEYLQAIEKRKKEIKDSIEKEEIKIKQEESRKKSEETKQKIMQDI